MHNNFYSMNGDSSDEQKQFGGTESEDDDLFAINAPMAQGLNFNFNQPES